MKINMAGIVSDSIVDGPGIRTTYFCQGCPHHCEGCHNRETWDFYIKKLMDVKELANIALMNPLSKGVTFSGGEPFRQAGGFAELAEILKPKGYEIAAYTGYTFEYLMEKGTDAQKRLLNQLDVLIDGPFILEQRSLDLMFKGSTNQRTINVPVSLKSGTVVLATGSWVEAI